MPPTLSLQATAVIRKHVGHQVHFHLLRHFAAMIYLKAYPGAYEAVRRLLGHATASVATELYIGFEAHTSVEMFDQVVLRLRRHAELVQKPKSMRKR